MKLKGSILILLIILCIASINDMPSVLGASHGDSHRGSCQNCTHVSSKTYFASSTDCPTYWDCTGTHVASFSSSKTSGDTLNIIIITSHCTGSLNCLYHNVPDYGSSSNCTQKTY